jgi:hypothetical protein
MPGFGLQKQEHAEVPLREELIGACSGKEKALG